MNSCSQLIIDSGVIAKCQHCHTLYTINVDEFKEGFRLAQCPHCYMIQHVYIGFKYKVEPVVIGYDGC